MSRNVLKRILIIIIPVMLSQVCTPVLAGNNGPTVYFTEGHGEQSIDKEFKKLKGILAQNNYSAKTVDLKKNKALPADLDVLVVLSPKTDLTIVEKNLISTYLGKGGKMITILDVSESGSRLVNFEEITKRFNLSPGYDRVLENDVNLQVAEDCHTFVPNMPENVINKKPYDILVSETISINITGDNQDANVLKLLESGMESVNEPIVKGMEEEEGPLTVAAASEVKTAGSMSRVVLLGSSKTFSDVMLSKFGAYAPNNLKYFMDILKWITKPKVTELSAGASHCLSILSDGTLWAWGSNQHGQLGDGTQIDKSVPVQIGKERDWVKVSAGTDYSLAIKQDGSLWAWGGNDCGQLGDGTTKDKLKPIKVSYQKFASVEAGRNHSLAIGADGSLWESGLITSDAYDAENKYRSKFRLVGRETNWEKVSVSEYQAMGLKKDGTLWRLGSPDGGTTITNGIVKWIRVGNRNDWKDIYSGNFFTIALKKDGSLWRMEQNQSDLPVTEPVQVGDETDWSGLAAFSFAAALKTDGTLWSWGYDTGYGTVMENQDMTVTYPTRIGYDNDWERVAVGRNYGVALKSDGTLWSWGYNQRGQLGREAGTSAKEPVRIGSSYDWAQVSAGLCHTLALDKDGGLWAWGSNLYGECGPAVAYARVETPVPVGPDKDWQKVFSIDYTSYAIKKDGTLWAWGHNSYGRFGNGNNLSTPIPQKVGNSADWKEVASDGYLVIGLKNDGTMWTWGNDVNSGGINVLSSPAKEVLEPVRVGTDSDWKVISARYFRNDFSAIKSDGSIWACYYTFPGPASKVFGRISNDKDWIDLRAGYLYNVMLKADHTLWYDPNSNGTIDKFTPAEVMKTRKWSSFSTYNRHVLAIMSDGSLWAFGQNQNGEIGDGTYVNREKAVRIGKGTNWMQVSAGVGYSLGIKSDGSLWAWGDNSNCQLGTGKTAYKAIPEEILLN